MMISVVLCNYNQSILLAETVQTILTQAVSFSNGFELVVVDNHSTGEARNVIETFALKYPGQIRYLFEPQQRRSFVLNTGIREAKGEILVLTNDDIVPRAGWLSSIHEAFEKMNPDGVGGPVLPVWETERSSWLTKELFCKLGLIDLGGEVRWFDEDHMPVGCNVAFRKEIFNRIGLYNTTLGQRRKVLLSEEDDEFFLRFLRAGYQLYYEPKATVLRRISGERMERSYLRRVEMYSGTCNAQMSDHEVKCLLNVPRYFYRRLIEALFKWFWLVFTGHWNKAFYQELFLWYFAGYISVRWWKRMVL